MKKSIFETKKSIFEMKKVVERRKMSNFYQFSFTSPQFPAELRTKKVFSTMTTAQNYLQQNTSNSRECNWVNARVLPELIDYFLSLSINLHSSLIFSHRYVRRYPAVELPDVEDPLLFLVLMGLFP